MKKSHVITLTLISTVVSLIFIVLSYYGITRYVSMRTCKNIEKYTNTYAALEHAGEDPKQRIVVVLSIPARGIHAMKPTIASILDQTVRVDQIALHVEDESVKTPEYMRDIINVFPVARNYGALGTRMIPALLREKDIHTIILALRGDYVYGKDYIETMVNEAEKHPKTLIIDSKHTSMLATPECFTKDVYNPRKEVFGETWFKEHAERVRIEPYIENYKCI